MYIYPTSNVNVGMGFAERLRQLDKALHAKKAKRQAEEKAKLEAAKKAQEELFRTMTPAERKAHEIAEKHRREDAEAGIQSAGGFGKTSVNFQKKKIELEDKEKKRAQKQWEQDMRRIEPVLRRRELREMATEDDASATLSALENRRRNYQELCAAEVVRQAELTKEKERLAAEEAERVQPGFTFSRSNFKRATKNKPTEGRLIKMFTAHKQAAKRAYFDEHGEHIVTCGMDKLVKVWNVTSQECVHGFSGHRHGVTCCSVIGTFNAGKGKAAKPFRVMSGDGSGTIMCWEEGNERPVLQKRIHDTTVYDCAFSPSEHGLWAITCSEDTTLRVMETYTGDVLCTFRGTKGAVACCAWSPNGHIALSGGGFEDTCIRVWDVTNAVIFMYILKGQFRDAIDTFERKVVESGIAMWPNFDTLNALVDVYMRRGDPQMGCMMYEEMMSRGMRPTENVVAVVRAFLQFPDRFWREERLELDYDSDEWEEEEEEEEEKEEEEEEKEEEGAGDEGEKKDEKQDNKKLPSSELNGPRKVYRGRYERLHQPSGVAAALPRPASASKVNTAESALQRMAAPKFPFASADKFVSHGMLAQTVPRRPRPHSAPHVSSQAAANARLAIMLESEKRLGPARNRIGRFSREFVLGALHTVLSRAEFVAKKKRFLDEAVKKRAEEQFKQGQMGTLGKLSVVKQMEEERLAAARKPKLPFIKLSSKTGANDLLKALGRLHTEVTGHAALIAKKRLYQALNFRVSPGHGVDSDRDPRAKKAMIVRFERQSRRVKRLRKHLENAIFSMDKTMDRVMGFQPCHTDVPGSGGGASTFLLRTFDPSRGHGDWVNDVMFTPDGRYILSAGSDSTVKVWDPQDGTMLQTLGPHPGWVNSISVMPKGDYVVAGSEDLLVVWKFPAILERIKIEAHLRDAEKDDLALSQLSPLKPEYTLRGHCDLVYHVSIRSDCRRICSCSHDMSVCVWQIVPGEPDPLHLRPFPTNVKTTSMQLNWIVPSTNGLPITGYRLVRRLEESEDYGDEVMIPPCDSPYGFVDRSRSYVIEHLRPGTVYEFKLAAVNAIGSAPWSKPMMPRRTKTTVPRQVLGRPEVVVKKARSCVLRWNAPMSFGTAVTSFRIQMRGGKIYTFGDVPDMTLSMGEAKGIAEKYKILLKEEKRKKIKKQSEKWGKYGRRLKKIAPPPVLMHKDAPKGAAPRKEDLELGDVPEVALEVDGLTPGSVYMFRVCGSNKKGEGEFSLSSYSIVTDALPPARMAAPVAKRVTPFSARVHFEAPNTNGNIIEDYRLFYGECGPKDKVLPILRAAEKNRKLLPDPDYDPYWVPPTRFDVEKKAKALMPVIVGKLKQKHNQWADMDGTHFDIDGLAPGKQYVFTIAARNNQGYGNASPVSDVVRTKCAPPGTPKQPFANGIAPTAITVNFTLPEGNGSKIKEIKALLLEGRGDHAMFRPEILLDLSTAENPPPGVAEDALPKNRLFVNPKEPGHAYMYRVGKLIGDQYYRIKVAGVNEEGMGPFSQLSPEHLTLPPIPPSKPSANVHVDETNPEIVGMHWGKSLEDGGSPIAGYLICARAFGGQKRSYAKQGHAEKNEEKREGCGGGAKQAPMNVPDGYEIIGSTGPSITKFIFKSPIIRAVYTFRVACFNHVGHSEFTESPPSIQVPSKIEYIAKQQKLKMEKIAEEKRKKAEAKKKQMEAMRAQG